MAGLDAVPRARLLAEFDLVLYVASIPTASNGPLALLGPEGAPFGPIDQW